MSAALAAAMVLLGAIPRLLLAADALPEGVRAFVWSDVLLTWERGLSGHRLPYWDTAFEYPPLIGYVSALFSLIAPSALVYVALWTAVQCAAAAVVAVALGPAARRRTLTWVLAPQLVLFGSVNFDLLAVAALVLAVRWAREGATTRSTVALAVGTALKLFPAVALPVLLLRRVAAAGRRAALRDLAVFAAIVAAAYLAGAGARRSTLESLLVYSVGIPPNFDSLWGLVAGALRGVGIDPAVPVLVLTLEGLAVTYLAVVLRRSVVGARDITTPIALAVLTLLLWTRLYSPQYSLWVLPFFALLGLPLRWFALLTAADVIVFATVYPLTLTRWSSADTLPTILYGALAGAVVLRHVALIALWLGTRRRAAGGAASEVSAPSQP